MYNKNNIVYHYKDNMPEYSIEKFRKILCDINLDVNEIWNSKSSIDTFSVRVSVCKNLHIGTNGKGITKELALASAYGEFFERLQNNLLFPKYNVKKYYGYNYFKDEKLLSSKEILLSKSSVVKSFMSDMNMLDKSERDNVDLYNKLFAKLQVCGKSVCVPFCNITTKQLEYIPMEILDLYGSNGMCAGNSVHEALIQGLSEIFERHALRSVFDNNSRLYEISEEVVKSNDYNAKMYNLIKKSGKYNIKIIDCTINKLMPVMALVVISKNSRCYGVSFGCHPNIDIAIERAFTEAMQGQDIDKFVLKCKFDPLDLFLNTENLRNIVSVGVGKYPKIFLNNVSKLKGVYTFDSKYTNKGYLKVIVNDLIKKGFDILIRDTSSLGVSSFQIIIPGLSNVIPFDSKYIMYRYQLLDIHKYLKTPSTIDRDNINYIISTLEYFVANIMYNSLEKIYKRNDEFSYPYSQYKLDYIYFMAIANYSVKQYKKAQYYLEIILKVNKINNEEKKWIEALLLLNKLKEGNENNYNILCYFKNFYDECMVKSISSIIDDEIIIISKMYPDDIIGNNDNMLDIYKMLKINENKRNINQMSIYNILMLNEVDYEQ